MTTSSEFSVLSTRTSKNVDLQTLCACSVRKTRTRSCPRPHPRRGGGGGGVKA